MITFGSSPKISTTVENTVEKPDVVGQPGLKRVDFGQFPRGEASSEADVTAPARDAIVVSP